MIAAAQRTHSYIELAERGLIEIVRPIVCVLEWWRGRTDRREAVLAAVEVAPVRLEVAQAAGLALAATKATERAQPR